MWLLYPLQSQLGHDYTCKTYWPLTFIQHRAWSGDISCSRRILAEAGGRHGSPAKQKETTSLNKPCRPVPVILSDEDKSDNNKFLKSL